MPACPACFGDGVLDLREMDAFLLEHFTADEIRAAGGEPYCGILDCHECEGTGVVSEERAADIAAAARASVDRVIAQYEAEHRDQAWPHGVEPPC